MDIHKIEITKKHNINKVFHLNLQRDITKDVKDSDITHFKQINYLNKHYLNQNIDDKVLEKLFITELKKKLSQYKNQDKTKVIFDKNHFITYDDIIEKLVCSKLKCYYCMNDVNILYKDLKQKNQWTLDRIDNDIGHNTDNVVISCLKCNLDRGTKDINKFNFTKKLKLIKKYDNNYI